MGLRPVTPNLGSYHTQPPPITSKLDANLEQVCNAPWNLSATLPHEPKILRTLHLD